MNFCFQALVRCIGCLLLTLLFFTDLSAQQPAGFGNATKPYTVVYKLKKPSNNVGSRTASPDVIQNTLKKLGAKQHKQKFPSHVATAAHNARMAAPSDLSRIYELQYSSNLPFEWVKRELMSTGLVDYVEPLYLREPFHQPNDPRSDSTKTDQYYLKLIQAYSGWEVEKGDATVIIGILDTGFLLTHSDLQGKIQHNELDPVDGKDNDGDGLIDNYIGWDFADRDNDVTDNTPYKGHGMGVAGVAAARTNNGIGMAGVGYNIKFMPLKVFPSTKAGSFAGYEALVYAADKGCKVINLSWGGSYYSQYEQDIINYVVLQKDVAVIASAGNNNYNQKQNMYPASYDNVISVGGTDQKDLKIANYTYSYKIDVTAPSKDIYTTHATGNSGYNITTGTSFGAPVVAATAALVRSRFPELNALQVMERVRVTTDNIYHLPGNVPYLEMLGKGRVNVKRALKGTNLKSVRSISFKTKSERPLQSGETVDIIAAFTNYLDPVQNLQVTLTSSSPYVTIADQILHIGAMATSGTANNAQRPFRITVSPDAPAHLSVPFRLGYTDGDYTDFQYFEIIINPEHITLTTDNLKLTLNGKGNLGYNGVKFNEGAGFTHRNSSSLLFEGGLMVAAGPDRVSDNLRNAFWMNEENFIPFSPAKVRYNTALADQTLMGAMRDRYPSTGQAGVEVKYRAYTWNTSGNKDFVVVEYQIKNITSGIIPSLHAGLFADWDIGTYYENAADWDATRKLGYVYSKTSNLSYTGIKLLTQDEASYYAIEDGVSTINTDNFTEANKYATLASGVNNSKAGDDSDGGNVSHVVGAVAKDLAPGEVKTIAFAILAGDNLENLQQNADAAQLKYISIKSGPAPVALADTICAGNPAIWAPQHGSNFRFYADADKIQLLGTGPSFTIENFTAEKTIYATNADSLFESAVSPGSFSLPRTPVADFSYESENVYPGTPVSFTSQSKFSNNLTWKFPETELQHGKNIIHVFPAPGVYDVELIASDNFNCTTSTITKKVTVLTASADILDQALTFYPNPAKKSINIQLLPNGMVGQMPEIILTDMVGRQITPKVESQTAMQAVLSLEGLKAGIYVAQVTYSNVRFTRRIVVL